MTATRTSTTRTRRGLHWDSWLLIAVAATTITGSEIVFHQNPFPAIAYPTTIPGLNGAAVESSAQALAPGTQADVVISSDYRISDLTITATGAGPHVTGDVTVESKTATGLAVRVTCTSQTTPADPISVADDPILQFCARLPYRGADPAANSAWVNQQFAAAKRGFGLAEDHAGVNLDVSVTQYGSDQLTYLVRVGPASG